MTTALITGANRGIGLELCRQLHGAGADVIAVCRNTSSDLEGIGVRVEAGVDLTDELAVDKLADRLEGVPIDLLINNAGVLTGESLDDMDFERIRRQVEVNAIAPLRVVCRLLGNLGRGAKVALITSRMGSIGDNTSGSRYGYRMSKAALNIAGVSLARDLRERGIAVALLHPGFVRTGMTNNSGDVDASVAAQGLLARIDELTIESSGSFWHANGERLPW